mmetsp:Transcript_41015/g.116827  ORF Transcript_41015/g.116827 Transcript_41015/m.116827 type:complete len:115 (+) Transcript_41015:42-386(+)|eukprot:CAMPEP_0184650914 /NCGR_PEP_ID=MMETSP0308-20130426/8483_1 /TAXON_ID=38269 /ORGANISM="Gloeochaete witrockiana, Strain SAG 46.84" /LENGTH=114 /DNA_ID=CAMNT_0027084773 /DNA_START=60 /DNA_END=404 /DNA_ORIENTATION=+
MSVGVQELAVTYAALILHDDGLPITADKISTLVKAAGVKIENYWPALFAKFLQNKNIDDLLSNVGAGGGAAAAPVAAAPAAGKTEAKVEAKKEEKKEPEKKEESEEDMGLGLFD